MLGGAKFTLAEVLVFAVCELIAIPLCDASWHAIVGEHEMIRGIVGLAVGIPTGIAGISFHWWKDSAKQWLIKVGKDWWPLALVLVIVWVMNPSFYTYYWRMMPWVGPVVWSVDDPNTTGFFIGMTQIKGQEIWVLGFQANGINTSGKPINDIKGYIKSAVTNKELPIYLSVVETLANTDMQIVVAVPPSETYGIPPFANFLVGTAKSKSGNQLVNPQIDGMSVNQFLADFRAFDFVFEYDGYKYKHHFTAEDVQKQFATFNNITSPNKSTTTPHVIRREQKVETAPKQETTP